MGFPAETPQPQTENTQTPSVSAVSAQMIAPDLAVTPKYTMIQEEKLTQM